jgi:hypothetical protein
MLPSDSAATLLRAWGAALAIVQPFEHSVAAHPDRAAESVNAWDVPLPYGFVNRLLSRRRSFASSLTVRTIGSSFEFDIFPA